MKKLVKRNSRAFLCSLALHALLIAIVASNISTRRSMPTQITLSKQEPTIIQASAVHEKAIATALARQAQAEKRRQQQLLKEKNQTAKIKQDAELARKQVEKLKNEAAAAKAQATEELAKATQAQKDAVAVKKQAEKNAKEQKELLAKQKAAELAAAEKRQQEYKQQRLATESEKLIAEIKQRIFDNRTLSSAFPAGLICKIRLKLLPDGAVNVVKVIASSGNPAYDAMAEAAVYKAAPFTMSADLELLPLLGDIVLEFTDEYTVALH